MAKRKRPKGYDSKLEKRLAEGPLKVCDYHPDKIQYEIPSRVARYEPDFKLNNILFEAKGRFRTAAEAKKYIHIKNSLPSNMELVFVFQEPNTPMPGAQKRKDGTKRSMAEWADSVDIRWYSEQNVIELIEKEYTDAEKD